MDAHNTKMGSRAFGEWRVDPDRRQDRRSGEVTKYNLSPEELEKYKDIKPYKKPSVIEISVKQRKDCEDMGKLIYDEKKLLDLCREYGTGAEGVKIASQELGLTQKQVENQIFNKGIRRILEREKKEGGNTSQPPKPPKNREIFCDGKVKEIVAKEVEGFITTELQRMEEQIINGDRGIKEPIGIFNSQTAPKISKYDRHLELVVELNTVYGCKNKDYGDSFGKTFQELGVISAVTRMYDKFSRIKALAKGAENKVTDESIKDTLKDMANYCLMTLIELEVQEGAHYDA